jgi:hypothetical protein
MPEITQSRVIPWELPNLWGVAIRYAGGRKVAYPVGSREDAERELLDPRPPWPDPAGNDNDAPALAGAP